MGSPTVTPESPDGGETLCLPLKDLLSLAKAVSDRYDLPPIPSGTFYRHYYGDPIPQPLMLANPHGCLWLDRYYGAYWLKDGSFHYFYLTATHVAEELAGWQEAARARQVPCRLPPRIRGELLSSLRDMKRSGSSVWLCRRLFPEAA